MDRRGRARRRRRARPLCSSATACACSRRRCARRTRPTGALHDAIRDHLAARGALVLARPRRRRRRPPTSASLLAALWDLVWAGEVTNDTFGTAARAARRAPRRRAAPGRRPSPGALRALGPAGRRRPLVARRAAARAGADRPPSARTPARCQLLERHGVVTREAVLAEGAPGGFAGVYRVLQGAGGGGPGAARLVRRRARRRAVRRSRARSTGCARIESHRRDEPRAVLVLAATDPAQPYGAALAVAGERAGRPGASAGAYVVLVDGALAAFLERGARTLLTFGVESDAWVDALASLAKDGRLRKIELHPDRRRAGQRLTHRATELRVAGFADGYRGLTLRS